MNDDEREKWVLNDEGLYRWQQRSRLSMRAFIRQNRGEIDTIIDKAQNGDPWNSGRLLEETK